MAAGEDSKAAQEMEQVRFDWELWPLDHPERATVDVYLPTLRDEMYVWTQRNEPEVAMSLVRATLMVLTEREELYAEGAPSSVQEETCKWRQRLKQLEAGQATSSGSEEYRPAA